MNDKQTNQINTCETCYRIACKQCDWIASEKEVKEIQEGLLNACPVCGWKPGKDNKQIIQ